MRRKVIGFVAALALAMVGTASLVAYVNGAEERAAAGEQRVEVFVVTDTVPAGTEGSSLGRYVDVEEVPAKVRVDDAVSSLEQLDGLVASVDLLPGEQVTRSRFVEQEELRGHVGQVRVPDGLLELTVSLEPERALGGSLLPGDRVAVFASFDPFDVNGPDEEDAGGDPGVQPILMVDGFPIYGNGQTPNSTHLILHKLLVTNVQREELPDDSDDDNPALAPTGNLLVTLALDTPSAERLVFTAEHGRVWLAHEPEDASEEGTSVQTRATIYSALGEVAFR